MKRIIGSLKYPTDIILLVILALIPRLLLLLSSQAGIESDEAIVGLMAKHISEGKDIPIFYYGQPYMGSLEAILVAPLFYLFGVNNYCLKLVPLIFSLGHIVLTYFLARKLAGTVGARIAALYVAIAPSPLIIWSLKARGGFIETIFLGSLALICTLNIFESKKVNLKNFMCLGLILGLGWWTNNQIIFFIAPIGLSLIYLFVTNKIYKLKDVVSITIVGIASFLFGGLPFWIYNLNEKPKWASFEVLFGQTAGGSSLTYFSDYWSIAVPIILGAKKFWSDASTYPNATLVIYTLLAFILVLGAGKVKKEDRSFPSLVLYLFLITTPIIFSLSSFGWLSRAPRYLLPIYSVLPVLIGAGIANLQTGKFKKISTIVISLVACHNLASNYLDGTIADEGQPMVYLGGRVAKDQTKLYEWLDRHSCPHIHTNYWIGYRTAFETKEKTTFTRFGNPRSLRLPDYENPIHDLNNTCGATYVLVNEEIKWVKNWLTSLGKTFVEEKVGDYNILSQVRYLEGKGAKLDVKKNVRVFIPPDNTNLKEQAINTNAIFDGSLETRWGSGQSQKPGMAIEIDFEKPTTIGSVSILFGQFKTDAPSNLGISAYTGPEERVFLFNMTGIKNQGDIDDNWDIRFKPITTTRLRFELMESFPVFDWSIAELELYAPPALEDTHK